MRAAAGAAFAFFLFLATGACAAPETEALAGLRLAALAERVAKLHAQLGHGIAPARSRRALEEALRDFDAALRAAGREVSAEGRDNHLLLTILWGEYRVWAVKPPTRENVRKLADRADEVAWVAAKASRAASLRASPALAAARACVLSQRVARLHMMRRLEPASGELSRELAAGSEELGAILERLASEPINSAEIAAEIQVAETQHGFLVRAGREMERTGEAAPHLENLAKTGDHILLAMGRVARMYQARGP